MKKLVTYSLLLVSLMLIEQDISAQWCNTGLYSNGCNLDYLQSFSTTGGSTNITNPGTNCQGLNGIGYTFYSAMTHTAIQNTNVNFTFTINPTWTETVKIWVDFNADGDFLDPGEEVYSNTLTPSSTVNGSFTVPITATPGLTRMRARLVFGNPGFTSCSNEFDGEIEDYNFMIVAATPCSGQPVAGTASVTGTCPTTISLAGTTLAGNMSVQWQKRVACGGNWTDIPGANNYSYSIGSQTTPTDYRAYVICNNSGLADTSNVVPLAMIAPCYCVPTTNFGCSIDYISNVTFAGINNTTGCTGATGPSVTTYTTPNPHLNKGATYPLSVTTGGDVEGVAVWIDFNINGIFETSEAVIYNQYQGLNPATYTTSVTIPMTAQTGQTRMRVRCQFAGGVTDPCSNYTYGEAEDYDIYIQYAPTVTGENTFCSGDTVVLTATAPGISGQYSFYWTGPGGVFLDTTATITIPNAQVSHTGVYTAYVITYPCGGGAGDTSGPKSVNVWVNQTPGPPVVDPVITYCQYSVFDSIPIFGQNLKWYTVPVGGVPTTVPPTVNTSVFSSQTYYVSQTINGCESVRVPVTINVVPQAPPPAVVSPVGYCQGDIPIPLQATGQNIKWYSVATGGVGTPITPTPSTNAQGTFTWYASQTIDGCESPRVPVEVNVSYRPNALVLASRPYVCQHDTMSIFYFGNALPNADYVWTLPTGASVIEGSGQGPLVIKFDTAGIQRVRLVVDNKGCVGPEAYIDVQVKLLPIVDIDMQPEGCQGDVINIAVGYATPGVDYYTWDFSGGSMIYGAVTVGPYGIRWDSPGEKVVTTIATDDVCKSLPKSDTIIVHALPDASIRPLPGQVCTGDSVRLEANTTNPAYTYNWQPQQFFAESHEPVQYAVIDFPRQIFLTVTSEFNCRATDSLLINAQPCCDIYLPSAFSPNGDGRNDVFRMLTVGYTKHTTGHHHISTFRIHNRWGQKVFETADERKGWDGTVGGEPQDAGTYYYYIKYKCEDGNFYEKKGEVTLVR